MMFWSSPRCLLRHLWRCESWLMLLSDLVMMRRSVFKFKLDLWAQNSQNIKQLKINLLTFQQWEWQGRVSQNFFPILYTSYISLHDLQMCGIINILPVCRSTVYFESKSNKEAVKYFLFSLPYFIKKFNRT